MEVCGRCLRDANGRGESFLLAAEVAVTIGFLSSNHQVTIKLYYIHIEGR